MKKITIKKIRSIILPNIKYLAQSQLRICGCCNKRTIFVSLSSGEERKICIRCNANLRYEIISEALRDFLPNLDNKVIIELDPNSPLKQLLGKYDKYIRTYYSDTDVLGSCRTDGARCEDITKLTFQDNSVDVLISSDVLEHVPDISKAFQETHRVLKKGGCHLFTVPIREKTKKRAEIINGEIKYLTKPEFHADPLNKDGILAFWDIGKDLATFIDNSRLSIFALKRPQGKDQRAVWCAVKVG